MADYSQPTQMQSNQNQAFEAALDEAYKSGWNDGSGGQKPSRNFNSQMMDTLFECRLPSAADDFNDYLELLKSIICILPRIPNYDKSTFEEINRDFEDIVDRAHSEGRKRVTASKMCKMIIRLRALVPRGDFPLVGLTGVSSMITSRNTNESTVKMPQQVSQSSGAGIFGFLPWRK